MLFSRALLFSTISSATFLVAAPQPQTFRRPLVFEPNRGQAPAEVKWLARGPGYQLFFTKEGVSMKIQESVAEPSGSPQLSGPGPAPKLKYSTVRMKLAGSRPWDDLTGLEPTGGVSNYFLGNDAKAWRTNVPQYNRVSAASVYEGIDAVFYANGADLEYDFVVKPGADPKKIRLAFEGQDQMRVDDKSGDLILLTAGGAEVRQVRPKVYQQIGNRRVEVAGAYELLDSGRATFALAGYDRRQPLIIDPNVSFTRFLAGSDRDVASSIALDKDGNAYVTGYTDSTNFPVNQEIQDNQLYTDAFVTKVSSQGGILFSTYLGGQRSDWGFGIAIDSTGIYVTGTTGSTDFPDRATKDNSLSYEAFVTKLRVDGGAIVYTAIVGDPVRNDGGSAITVDPATHEAYVTGYSNTNTVPLTGDALIFKLSPSGSLSRSFFVGGTDYDWGSAIALDHNGNVWIAGTTCSANFPVVFGTPQQFPGAGPFACPGFISRWSSDLALTWSRFWGAGYGIAVNRNNNVYVTGSVYTAFSTSVGTTPGAFQAFLSSGSSYDAFVTKFNSYGEVLNSTYLGGPFGNTRGEAIAVDAAGEVYVSGNTSSSNFPGAPILTPNPTAGFVSRLSTDLSALRYSKLLGAEVTSVALFDTLPANPPEIYTAGSRYTGGVSLSNLDAFVVKLDDDPGPPQSTFFAETVRWDYGFGDAFGWNQPQYGATVMFADINGDGKADVCGRGQAGIYCELSTGTGFGPLLLSQNVFSDAQGWNLGIYYTSLRLADVNGDGKPEICGRGQAGVYCALNNGDGTFRPATLWESTFSDANGWGLPQYGTTIMFADINGDGKADLCGRGRDGIWCELSTGTGFGRFFLAHSAFSDANGWSLADYSASLRFADVNGDGKPDICGRGQAGVYCALNTGSATFGPMTLWEPTFSDANGWSLPQYGNTMMFADINGDGKADVCGRGQAGMYCELSTGTGFGPLLLTQTDFADTEGWSQPVYYASLRFADVNGDGKPDICGRANLGNYCALSK